MTQTSVEPQHLRNSANTANAATKHNCDILLNNFQIKKKRYRVLFNCDHIVWERFDAKRDNGAQKNAKKAAELETEQLSSRAAYGSSSNVVHMNEIVRVSKGETKSATFHLTPDTTNDLGLPGVSEQSAQKTIAAPTEQYLTLQYAERIVKSARDCNRWHLRSLTLYNADPYIIKQWHALLAHVLKHSSRCRVQRLLVFINPYGGQKQGLQTYERFCKPLFQLAGIDASCIISQRANQIRDILTSHDLTPFDAVCCVGGDGTVAEVINGLIFRTMRDLGMDPLRPDYIPKPSLPVGIIPAGSTDTVAYSVHGTSDVRTAAIHLMLGQCRGLDICSVSNRQGIVRFCASVMSYGYLGDIAAKSEKYRWMGTKRYEYTGVKAFLSNRGYEAEVRLLLENENEPQLEREERHEATKTSTITGDRNSTTPSVCYANCQRCSLTVSVQQDPSSKSYLSNETVNDVDDELPTSSNVSLCDKKPKNEEDSGIGSKLHSTYNELKDGDKDRNLNIADCDRNVKALMLGNQLSKDNEIRELLNMQPICDNDVDMRRTADCKLPAQSVTQDAFSFGSTSSCNNNAQQLVNEPTATQPKWKVIKGNFFMISGANITCACTRSPNGISRYSHLGDGHLDLILVRKTSMLNNVRFAMNTMGRNGDICNLPFVEIYHTKKFNFRALHSNATTDDHSITGSCQPITASAGSNEDDDSISSWNCDGEVVTDLDITMRSHCQLVDVFMRGPFSYTKPNKSDDNSTFCCCTSKK